MPRSNHRESRGGLSRCSGRVCCDGSGLAASVGRFREFRELGRHLCQFLSARARQLRDDLGGAHSRNYNEQAERQVAFQNSCVVGGRGGRQKIRLSTPRFFAKLVLNQAYVSSVGPRKALAQRAPAWLAGSFRLLSCRSISVSLPRRIGASLPRHHVAMFSNDGPMKRGCCSLIAIL
jgi:hypothetical protein